MESRKNEVETELDDNKDNLDAKGGKPAKGKKPPGKAKKKDAKKKDKK